MADKAKKKEKYTIEEYQKITAERKKRKFHFQPYPWPVTLALSVPFIFFVIITLLYILYIKGFAGE
jgi:hypothetical protein